MVLSSIYLNQDRDPGIDFFVLRNEPSCSIKGLEICFMDLVRIFTK